ncbi:MAG TPA: RNA methyltransferase [Candidatus Obscuribacterales bacterium]
MLTSLKNPWVKELRKLHQAKYRSLHQQFLVEGTHLVEAAIATQYPLHAVCATPHWQAQHPDLWAQVQTQAARSELVSPAVLAAIATTETPDGVIAIAPQPPAVTTPGRPHLGLVLEALQDPGNVGTLMRTAAAAGCDGLWLSGDGVELTHPKVLRASAGQWFRVAAQKLPHWPTQATVWQQQGCQILATAATGAVPYWEVDLTQPTVLLLGNEGAGLSAEAIATANQIVAIPMMNGVESLNVGVAAAVILFEAVRQRLAGGATQSPLSGTDLT